jgi:hypothetical protein
MAEDIQSNIRINVDTAGALANIKNLQGSLSAFYSQMAKSGAASNAVVSGMQQNFINSVNMSGKFAASIQTIKSSTESFNQSLEKNKFSLNEYFRYGIAASKSFGKVFKTEYETINKVATERVKDIQTQYIKMGRDANGALKSIAIRPLALDMENLSTKTQMAAQKQQILNQLLKQGSTQLLNWGKNTQWAGRQLMVGFSIPIAMAGAAAAKAYQQIEQGSIQIRRVYGDLNTTAQETDMMVGKIQKLAASYTQYGVAVSDTMAMAAQAAAMGKTGADLLAQIDQATKLSVLGGVDQKQALETTISLTNAFGISTSQLSDKINYLNAVENQTVLSIEDMTTAIPKAAPIVKQLGGNVEDLAFFMTAMKEGGVNASEGANAIKSGLAAIINPTKKASDFLSGFGINVSNIVKNDKGNLKKTVVDFGNALNTLDPLNRAKAIEMMFGKFQFARMSTLFKNVTDESSQASKAMELANMSAIQRAAMARKELDKIQSSPMYKFQKAMADFQLKMAPVGEAFLKAVTPALEVVGKLLTWFNKLGDGSKSFIVNTIAVVGGLAPIVLMTVGLVGNGIANFLKLFSWVKSVFNKATTASQVLGETTSYMTQEQLQAASVAASLDQIHSKLKQTITSEAEAISLYTQELKKANLAASQFVGPVMAFRGNGGRKMATGGMVVGPGGPKDDAVPTNLSNGEAVIDAATVKKNPAIISALFQGRKINVPGFKDNNSKMFRTYTNAVALLGSDTNQALKGGGVSSSNLSSEIKSLGAGMNAPIIEAVAKSLGATNNKQVLAMLQSNPELAKFATDIQIGVATAIEKQGGKINDPKLSEIYQNVARKESAKRGQAYADATEQFLTQPTTFEDSTIQRVSSSNPNKTRSVGRKSIFKGLQSYRSKNFTPIANALGTDTTGLVKAHMSEPQMSDLNTIANKYNLELSTVATAAAQRMKDGIVSTYQSVSKAVRESTRQASPSKDAYDAGANIGKGAINGIKSEQPEAEAAGKAVAEAVNSGVTQAKKQNVGSITRQAYSRDYQLKSLEIQRKQALMMGADTAAIDKEIKARRASLAASVKERIAKEKLASVETQEAIAAVQAGTAKKMMTVGEGLSKLDGKFTKFSAGITTAVFSLGMLPGPLGDIANAISPVIGIISLLGSGLEFLSKKVAISSTAIDVENAARAVETGEMEAENVARGVEVAETGALTIALGALELPLLPVIAGFVALAAIIGVGIAINNSLNEANKKALEDAKKPKQIAADTKAAMGAFGNLTGSTLKMPQIAGAAAGAASKNGKQAGDIQTLLDSSDFKNKDSEIGKVIGDVKGMGAKNAKNYIKNLGQTLLASGMDKAAVDSLIKAIQIAAGKENLKIEFADIDLTTKTGRAGFAKTAAETLAKISTNTNSSEFKQWQRGARLSRDAKNGKVDLGFASQEDINAVNAYKANMAAYLKIATASSAASTDFKQGIANISTELANGLITSKQFTGSLSEMAVNISKSAAGKTNLLNTIGSLGGQTAKDAASSLKSVNDQLLLMTILQADPTKGQSIVSLIKDKKIAQAKAEMAKFGSVIKSALGSDSGSGSGGGGGGGGSTKTNLLKQTSTDIASANLRLTMLKDSKKYVAGFIDLLATADDATRKQYIVAGKLTSKGLKLKELFDQKVVSEFIVKQKTATVGFAEEVKVRASLSAKVKDQTTLTKMLADADFKAAYASALNITNAVKRKKAINDLIAAETNFINAEQTSANASLTAAEKQQKVVDYLQAKLDKATAESGMPILQDKIDVYNDGLNVISVKEDAINKAYDARVKALEEIQKAQEDISQQQQDQLDVADAITKGDMAAAARAVQQSRKNAAERAMRDQSTALETARQTELNSILVSINGEMLNRESIEKRISDIQAKMYDIQLNTLDAIKSQVVEAQRTQTILAANQTMSDDAAFANQTPAAPAPISKTEAARLALIHLQSSSVEALSAEERALLNISLSPKTPVAPAAPKALVQAPAGLQFLPKDELAKMGYYATGGFIARGSDTVPAMLTPGEFVMNRGAVSKYGSGLMDRINSGTFDMPSYVTAPQISQVSPVNNNISSNVDNSSVYNNSYSVNIHTTGSQDTDSIARAVIGKIREYDSQRVRGVRI